MEKVGAAETLEELTVLLINFWNRTLNTDTRR